MKKIGVGIVGASPLHPGWAVAAHLPAVRALEAYELRAVSTSNAESAYAAALAYGVPAFDRNSELIAHPEVDLVVVTVKLPGRLLRLSPRGCRCLRRLAFRA